MHLMTWADAMGETHLSSVWAVPTLLPSSGMSLSQYLRRTAPQLWIQPADGKGSPELAPQ